MTFHDMGQAFERAVQKHPMKFMSVVALVWASTVYEAHHLQDMIDHPQEYCAEAEVGVLMCSQEALRSEREDNLALVAK
jgi:hypothetical protein